MPDENELVAVARAIVDAGLYLVLGTADESGRPWVTPVYYAPASYRDFLRVSAPEARHSMNLEARPETSIVIIDSSAPIGTGQAVYMSATARQLGDDEPRSRSTSSPGARCRTGLANGRRRTCTSPRVSGSIGRRRSSSTCSTSATAECR